MTRTGSFPSPSTLETKLIRGYRKGKEAAESQIEMIVKKKKKTKNQKSRNSTKLPSCSIRLREQILRD